MLFLSSEACGDNIGWSPYKNPGRSWSLPGGLAHCPLASQSAPGRPLICAEARSARRRGCCRCPCLRRAAQGTRKPLAAHRPDGRPAPLAGAKFPLTLLLQLVLSATATPGPGSRCPGLASPAVPPSFRSLTVQTGDNNLAPKLGSLIRIEPQNNREGLDLFTKQHTRR